MKWTRYILLVVICCFTSCSAPQSVAQNFIYAILEGNEADALKYMHIVNRDNSDEITFVQEILLPPLMRRLQRVASSNGGVQSISTILVEEKSDTAIVRYTIRFNNDAEMTNTMELQKHSAWFVLR